jgi:hypothetical protein
MAEQKSMWVVTIERHRTWDGVMVPPHQRYRSTQHIYVSPFVPATVVRERAMINPKMDRILRVERKKEVIV